MDPFLLQVLIEDTPAVFRLTQGSGPIHLSGTHQVETTIIEDDMDDSLAEEEGEEEDEVEEEVEDLPVSSSWKYWYTLVLFYNCLVLEVFVFVTGESCWGFS